MGGVVLIRNWLDCSVSALLFSSPSCCCCWWWCNIVSSCVLLKDSLCAHLTAPGACRDADHGRRTSSESVASSSSFLAAVNKPKIRNPLGFGENTQVLYHCLALYISEQLLFVPSLIIGVDKTRVVHTSLSVCEVLNMVCPTVARLTAFLICIILPFFFFFLFFPRVATEFHPPPVRKVVFKGTQKRGTSRSKSWHSEIEMTRTYSSDCLSFFVSKSPDSYCGFKLSSVELDGLLLHTHIHGLIALQIIYPTFIFLSSSK
jgi:hypothetical protein